jgi:multicomponent Na+:H+ antiporter subunit C
MTAALLYALAGAVLFAGGFFALVASREVLRKVLALNVISAGAFLLLVGLAQRAADAVPDPVAHALVLTGIVVAVSATALALALARAAARDTGTTHLPEDD